jgi:hypothetical protein
VLDAAAAMLVDVAQQRQDASDRTADAAPQARAAGAEHQMGDDGGHRGDDPARHDMQAGHDMGGHAGHDMGGMEMPGGVPMAERGEDRDGLKLDQLHVPLGPALPDWPVGLGLRLTLQGDVIQEAQVRVYTGDGEVAPWWTKQPWWTTTLTQDVRGEPSDQGDPVARLDSLQRLLFVAGWPAAAVVARRLRDDLHTGAPTSAVRREYERWSRRVRKSRLLRWSTDRIGVLAEDVPAPLRGDATARWMRWLDDVDAAFASPDRGDGRLGGRDGDDLTRITLDVLPRMLVGQELAAARLIVASLDPDIEALVASGDGALAHG